MAVKCLLWLRCKRERVLWRRRTIKVARSSLLPLHLLLIIAIPCQIYAQTPDSKGAEMQALEQRLNSLQTQVDELQSQLARLKSSAPAAQDATSQQRSKGPDAQQAGSGSEAGKELKTGEAVNKVTAEYETSSQDQDAAARLDNEPLD